MMGIGGLKIRLSNEVFITLFMTYTCITVSCLAYCKPLSNGEQTVMLTRFPLRLYLLILVPIIYAQI